MAGCIFSPEDGVADFQLHFPALVGDVHDWRSLAMAASRLSSLWNFRVIFITSPP